MARPKTSTRGRTPARVAQPKPAPPAVPTGRDDGGGPSGAGAGPQTWIDWLDPKSIRWPAVRITSEYDEERAANLRASMAEFGQQEGIGVYLLEDGVYEGASGKNRCEQAVASGSATVMCVVRRGTHRSVVAANLATALNQGQSNPLSEVETVAHAFHNEGMDLAELRGITGKSEDWLEKRLRIAEASPVVKQCLGDRRIAIAHAALLADIEGHEAQEELLHLLLQNGWTEKQLEAQIRGEENAPEGDQEEPHRARNRRPVACHYCATEHAADHVQRLLVCQDCLAKAAQPPELQKNGPGEGQVIVPLELLKEAASILAGSQGGASIAERFAVLVEG